MVSARVSPETHNPQGLASRPLTTYQDILSAEEAKPSPQMLVIQASIHDLFHALAAPLRTCSHATRSHPTTASDKDPRIGSRYGTGSDVLGRLTKTSHQKINDKAIFSVSVVRFVERRRSPRPF